MKRILIGLIAAVFAVTSGVFANDGEHLKFSLAAVTYYNVGSGVYTSALPSGSCDTVDPNRCSYVFPNPNNEVSPSEFILPSTPTNLGDDAPVGALNRYQEYQMS